jgi:N6-adenosine-specific RNA methylase IME4
MITLPGLEGKQYPVIYADPPWMFKRYSNIDPSRAPENHYSTMSLDTIKQLPVAAHATSDCVLLLWACDPMLPQALDVISAWGFQYKTVGFYWTKLNKSGNGLFTGLGYWTRANPEQCLLATRGHPTRKSKSVPKLVQAPRREHSRKPDEVIERIEQLLDGPYLELFSRQGRPGWDAFGDETRRFNQPAEDLIAF